MVRQSRHSGPSRPGLGPCGEVCIGEELGATLIAGQGWLADQTLIAGVLHRCVGKQVCERLQDVVRSAAPPYQVILPNPADPQGIGFMQPTMWLSTPRCPAICSTQRSTISICHELCPVPHGAVTEDQRKLERVHATSEK